MSQKRLLTGILAAGALLVVNCSNLTMLRTRELRIVQANVDSLRTELVTLQKTMHQEQKNQSEVLRLIR